MDPSSSTDYESTSRLSTSTLWGYTPKRHVSEFNVQAILSSEGHGHAPVRVKLFWSTEIVEGLNLLSRYHSGCIQIKSGEVPPPYDFRTTVDNQRVTSEWVVISEKSQIQIGRTLWRLNILQIKELTITKFLGSGGSAFVYEVQIPDRPFRYAIKIPRYPEYDHLIRGEHQMLKLLEEDGVPGVIRALEIMERWEDHTGSVLVLELGGRSLIDRALDTSGKKPFNVNRIARSLSKTLAKMHLKGVDHGDIKPSNILLSPKGSVTLIDITTVKASTPDFAPPEAQDSEYEIDKFTPETDCYQLSMVLCMLLRVNKDPCIVSTGRHPKETGLYGHSEKNGKRRAHFAVLRQTVGELEVDFVRRLQAVPRQRLTMPEALQHPYLNPKRGRRALRSRAAAH